MGMRLGGRKDIDDKIPQVRFRWKICKLRPNLHNLCKKGHITQDCWIFMKLSRYDEQYIAKFLKVISRSPGVIQGQMTKTCWIIMKPGGCDQHLT